MAEDYNVTTAQTTDETTSDGRIRLSRRANSLRSHPRPREWSCPTSRWCQPLPLRPPPTRCTHRVGRPASR